VRAFLQRWLVTTFGVLIASQLVSGINYGGFPALITASLLLGVFNAVLRPVILILSLPLLLLTFGLLIPIVNGLLLLLVGYFVKGFDVAGFWAAFWGGIVIGIVSWVANGMIGKPEQRAAAAAASAGAGGGSSPSRSSAPRPPEGKGPIIDV
jgi:putative membrane protein